MSNASVRNCCYLPSWSMVAEHYHDDSMFLNTFSQLRVGCASAEIGFGWCANDSIRGFRNFIGLGLRSPWSIDVSVGREPDQANRLYVNTHTRFLVFSVRCGTADKIVLTKWSLGTSLSAWSLCLCTLRQRTAFSISQFGEKNCMTFASFSNI